MKAEKRKRPYLFFLSIWILNKDSSESAICGKRLNCTLSTCKFDVWEFLHLINIFFLKIQHKVKIKQRKTAEVNDNTIIHVFSSVFPWLSTMN